MKKYRKTRIAMIDIALLLGILMLIFLKCSGNSAAVSSETEIPIPMRSEVPGVSIVSQEQPSEVNEMFLPSRSAEIIEEEITDFYPLSEEERELILRVVAAESRGEPLEGQMAVCQVILDRCIEWNKRPIEVLTAEHQFAKPYKGDLSEYPSIEKAVSAVFTDGERIFEDTALFFFNPATANPAAVRQLREYNFLATIGNHEFRGKELIK